MFSKFFLIFPLTAAVTVAGIMWAGLATAAAPVSNHVIYQDNFQGTATGPLNGAAPTVDNGTSAAWQAYSGWYDDGSFTKASSGGTAYLSFTPSSGKIYTLTAGLLDATSGGWIALGFTGAASTGGQFPAHGVAWALVAQSNAGGRYFTGPGTAGGEGFGDNNGVQVISITLNTTAKKWTYRVFDNGSAVSPVVVFKTNPTISAVGFYNNAVAGKVSAFELSVRKQKK